MAIGFARLEFVKRSSGKNACHKSAYNSRSQVKFQGTEFAEPKTYNFVFKGKVVHHEVLLPSGVDEGFKNLSQLWNTVEKKENRKNSVLGMELVVALPDDSHLSAEDRIHLVRSFVQENFTKQGLAAQFDVHPPDKKVQTVDGQSEVVDHNWHAHVLITTRRFSEDGKTFASHKARDMTPALRNGRVVSGPDWGKMWAKHQNAYFEEKGLSLRVDLNGAVPQMHLGPVRMRGRAFALLEEHHTRLSLNELECQDPGKILERLTDTRNIFSSSDVERFLDKFVPPEHLAGVRDSFWRSGAIVQLLDQKTSVPLDKFTSKQVLEEEKKALRLAERLCERSALKVNSRRVDRSSTTNLTSEQKKAFDGILSGNRLSMIEGHAGTGKSYLLASLRDTYQSQGYVVRALGPDNATSDVLKEKGFSDAENIYRFLFAYHHGKREIQSGKEVWVLDEAGKLGNRPLLELLKAAEKKNVQVVLSGCSSQISAVERGHLFTAFSKRFGAQHLENIQRQKEEKQREIAKRLALGDMRGAIDRLVDTGGINWSHDKKGSIEELITRWAQGRQLNPKESSIIVAHTNNEVRTLNEVVRQVRKELGEIGTTEYQCDSAMGTLYVSQGDKIEFRRNSNDLAVTNGTRGTLTEASPERFVVLVREKDKSRKVSFDPREYRSFQLGYATTFYRSQGQTVDRAYVLHSPYMNKPMFYVGLTRHVNKAELFVSREETSCLSDLKSQVFRESLRENTFDYTTTTELRVHEKREVKQAHIDSLKHSNSLLDKARGFGLSTLGGVQTTVAGSLEKMQDRRHDKEFYLPKLDNQLGIGVVSEVGPEASEPDNVTGDASANIDVSSLVQRAVASPSSPRLRRQGRERGASWDKLSQSHKELVKGYYDRCDEASGLYTVYKSNGVCEAEWKEACIKRNESAHQLMRDLPSKQLTSAFSQKSMQIVAERSSRHDAALQARENASEKLQAGLSDNIEPLLYSLFPDGPMWKDRNSMRFGGKGSLSVAYSGGRLGSYYDFENKEGGGLLKLIQRERGLSYQDAKVWAQNFLGKAPDMEVPKSFQVNRAVQAREGSWTAIKPKSGQAPGLSSLSRGLDSQFNEISRHAYRDEKGDVLFYTLRLVDKMSPSKKVVLPLSYGYQDGNDSHCRWSLKGYSEGKRPLYNLDQLASHPQATVLIVEGEKTADGASQLFPQGKYVCVSWCGGSSAVSKTDWTPLYNRNVVIWPDNDRAGLQAADQICSTLRRVGMKSLKEVSSEILRKEFPEKWDLADPLPQGVNGDVIGKLLLNANEKSVDVESLVAAFPKIRQLSPEEQFVEKAWLHDILWRVEERLRPSLEETHGGKTWEIRRELLQCAQDVALKGDRMRSGLQVTSGIGDQQADQMAKVALLYEAQYGRAPSSDQIDRMKHEVREYKINQSVQLRDGDHVDRPSRPLMEYGWIRAISETGMRRGNVCDVSEKAREISMELCKQFVADQSVAEQPARGLEYSV